VALVFDYRHGRTGLSRVAVPLTALCWVGKRLCAQVVEVAAETPAHLRTVLVTELGMTAAGSRMMVPVMELSNRTHHVADTDSARVVQAMELSTRKHLDADTGDVMAVQAKGLSNHTDRIAGVDWATAASK